MILVLLFAAEKYAFSQRSFVTDALNAVKNVGFDFGGIRSKMYSCPAIKQLSSARCMSTVSSVTG